MGNLYIGGYRAKKGGGIMWKLALFFFVLALVLGGALKVSAPFLVEKWLNERGNGEIGYAYSVRDVELSLQDGEMILSDFKIFNPKTNTTMIESPAVKLKMNLADVLQSADRRIKISSDKVDVFLSKDLTSEINRIKNDQKREKWYFSLIEAKFSEMTFIEKKTDMSRTLINFNEVDLQLKELTPVAVNNKTEFTLTSKIAKGGEINLLGKLNEEEEGERFWSIEGSLKEFAPELLNRLAGSELPFTFNEPLLNAEITARSRNGELRGEIVPAITRLNLVNERPGFERQVIARALSEELTFTLPFTLKDELHLQYDDTYKKLKEYRKYPQSVVSTRQ